MKPFIRDVNKFFLLGKEASGFSCPKRQTIDDNGQADAHPKYPHPTDCQRFYVCLNGVEARDLGCMTGEVYNEETKMCDAPENVPGWWVFSHLFCSEKN